MRTILLLLLSFSTEVVLSQLYTEVSAELGISHSYINGTYGGGVSFYDADHDGWDDITLCTNEQGVLFYRNNQGDFEPQIILTSISGQIKQAIWIDYDNDGDADLFVTRRYNSWKLYKNNGNLSNLTDVTEESGLAIDVFPQTGGSSWADVDNDGDLDVYIPNYDFAEGAPTNFFYLNNGDATFTNATESSALSNGAQPSFQSLFFDYDKDDDQDLFIINDRTPHSNTLYKNTNGEFTDVTAESGLLQYIFAMNASISDIDHDGEFELYISNNPFGNSLFSYHSEGDYFSDISSSAGVQVFDHSWSALWIDANNDRWEDLHVAVSPFWGNSGQDHFYFNAGDGTFQYDVASSGFSGDSSYTHSTAMGDFDQNGFPDLIATNDFPELTEIFQNNGNENHYLKIGLEGVNCNKDAIGARIDLWIDGDLQMRTSHAGEGYLTQNSQYELFGLGSNELVDSLTINWPNGFKETMFNIEGDQFLQIVEGEITEAALTVHGAVYTDEFNLCNSNEILLVASSPNFISWNEGAITDSLTVSNPGTYYYHYILDGSMFTSDSVFIEGVSNYSVDIELFPPSCHDSADGSISFNHPTEESLDYYTINNFVFNPLDELIGGEYELHFNSVNGCEYSETVLLDAPTELSAIFTVNQAPCAEDVSTVEVDISGGTSPISTSWTGFDPSDAAPGTFTPFVQDANGCSFYSEIEVLEVTPISIEFVITASTGEADGIIESDVTGGTGEYDYMWTGPNGFYVTEPTISNLLPGIYTLIVSDENQCSEVLSVFLNANAISELEDQYKVYPNPASSYVLIESDQPIQFIELVTLDGRKLMSTDLTNQGETYHLDLSEIPSGMVFITINTNELSTTKKIMVKH